MNVTKAIIMPQSSISYRLTTLQVSVKCSIGIGFRRIGFAGFTSQGGFYYAESVRRRRRASGRAVKKFLGPIFGAFEQLVAPR